MTFVNWMILAAYVLLCLGPLRRPLFSGRRWRFGLAFSVGVVAGVLVGMRVVGPHDPWFVPSALGLVAGLGLGAATKRWLDEELGRGD